MPASCALQLVPWDADIQRKPPLAWPFPSSARVSILFSAAVRHCSIAPDWRGFVKRSEHLDVKLRWQIRARHLCSHVSTHLMVKLHLNAELLRQYFIFPCKMFKCAFTLLDKILAMHYLETREWRRRKILLRVTVVSLWSDLS